MGNSRTGRGEPTVFPVYLPGAQLLATTSPSVVQGCAGSQRAASPLGSSDALPPAVPASAISHFSHFLPIPCWVSQLSNVSE